MDFLIKYDLMPSKTNDEQIQEEEVLPYVEVANAIEKA